MTSPRRMGQRRVGWVCAGGRRRRGCVLLRGWTVAQGCVAVSPRRAVSLRGAAPRKIPQDFSKDTARSAVFFVTLKKIIRLKVENAKNNRYNIGVKS